MDSLVLGLAQQELLGEHHGGRMVAPGLCLEGVELVEPAAFEADVEVAVVEEATGVAIAAVAPRAGFGQTPKLLPAAEAHGAVGRHLGAVDGEGVAPARAGEDEVPVVLAGRVRVLDDCRRALDDVVPGRLPDHLAGDRVDLVEVVVVAAEQDVEPAAVTDQNGLPRPADARPDAGRVLRQPAARPAAADLDAPDDVQAAWRGAEAVEVAPEAAEEARHLDAVAVLRDGLRGGAAGQHGGRDGGGGGVAGRGRLCAPVTAAAATGEATDREGDEGDDQKEDEQGGDAAPAQLAAPRRPARSLPGRPRAHRRKATTHAACGKLGCMTDKIRLTQYSTKSG